MAKGKPIKVDYQGERITLAALAQKTGIPRATLLDRIRIYGWTVERAATTPITKRMQNGGRVAKGLPRPVPKLKRHATGRAYSRWKIGGKAHERYFGVYGSAEATRLYRQFSQEWIAGKFETTSAANKEGGITVAKLSESWLSHVREYYTKDGKPTGEVAACVAVARAVNELYGATLAAEFDPAALRACRQSVIDRGLTRRTCNSYQSRICRLFAWGAGQSLVKPDVPAALKYVEYLKSGRTTAPDRDRKKPATEAQVAATLPHLCPAEPERRPKVADMIRIQRLAGMRPGEICAMARGDLDTAADVWRYEVGKANKNRHRGKRQVYYLGPQAVAILRPYLAAAPDSGPIFGEKVNNYGQAVCRASVRSGAGQWMPHQLRHALATAVAERFRSLEHAAAAIGDTTAMAEAVYIHVDPQERAKIEVARAMG